MSLDPRSRAHYLASLEALTEARCRLAEVEAQQSLRRIATALGLRARERELAALSYEVAAASGSELIRGAGRLIRALEAALANSLGDAQPCRVLLLCNDRGLRRLVEHLIDWPGVELTACESVAAAEDRLRERPPQLLVCGLGGSPDARDLLLRLRLDPPESVPPTLVLGRALGALEEAECLALGADACRDPARGSSLRALVARLLSRGPSSARRVHYSRRPRQWLPVARSGA